MATARSHGSQPPRPPAASHPPTGATAIARPRNACVDQVKRLASEYQKTIASATGDSARHSGPSWYADQTNTGRGHADEEHGLAPAHAACRQFPRGGPGVQAVEARVDEPVESHRRAPRAHHRDHDPGDPLPGERDVPRRQQRPGQRERQREHRMGDADEGRVRAKTFQQEGLWSIGADLSGLDARYQVLFHIRRAGRNRHGDQGRPAAPRDGPVRLAESQGLGTGQRGAAAAGPRA